MVHTPPSQEQIHTSCAPGVQQGLTQMRVQVYALNVQQTHTVWKIQDLVQGVLLTLIHPKVLHFQAVSAEQGTRHPEYLEGV